MSVVSWTYLTLFKQSKGPKGFRFISLLIYKPLYLLAFYTCGEAHPSYRKLEGIQTRL